MTKVLDFGDGHTFTINELLPALVCSRDTLYRLCGRYEASGDISFMWRAALRVVRQNSWGLFISKPEVPSRVVREKLGLDAFEFGQLWGVSANTVYKWETKNTLSSRRPPQTRFLFKALFFDQISTVPILLSTIEKYGNCEQRNLLPLFRNTLLGEQFVSEPSSQ